MATEIKPLFRPDALRPKLTSFLLPARCDSASSELTNWSNLLDSRQAEGMKETELLADFIRDVFVDLLGYAPPPANPCTLKREAIAFCEDRGLLPRDIIARAYEHADPFNPRPTWHNFVGLFRSDDAGNDRPTK
jgi:hypothetical protein